MQAPRDLLPNLVCPSAAQLRAKGSPAVGLHTGISVPLVLYPSFSSGLSLPTLAQRGCSTSSGEQRGFCFQRGCPGTEAFCQRASPCPTSLGCARGSRGAPGSRAGDTTGPPSRAHVFPNHLNPPAFEQTL